MIRRIVNIALLFAAAGLIVLAGRDAPPGSRRAVIVTAIAGLGVICNMIGVVRHALPVRAWLRNLAAFVVLLFLAGALASSYIIEKDALPTVPREDARTREELAARVEMLRWCVVALLYASCSIAALPARRPPLQIPLQVRSTSDVA